MPEDEKRKIEKEVFDTLTLAQLPPLGTAMYDGVWEWIFELVLQAQKAKFSTKTTDRIQCEETKMPPVQSSSPPAMSAEEPCDTDSMMDISDPGTVHVMNISHSEVAPLHDPPRVQVSDQTASQMSTSREIVSQEEESPIIVDEPNYSSPSSTSVRNSESDSPLTHDNTWAQLLQQCLYGVAVCAVRCPAYFKPLYRLSSALLALGLPKVNY